MIWLISPVSNDSVASGSTCYPKRVAQEKNKMMMTIMMMMWVGSRSIESINNSSLTTRSICSATIHSRTYIQNPSFTARSQQSIDGSDHHQMNAQKCKNNNIKNMNDALTSFFLEEIPKSNKNHLKNDLVGRTASNFWSIFNTFLSKYGVAKPMDIEKH